MKSFKFLIFTSIVKLILSLPLGPDEVLYEPSEIAGRTLDDWVIKGAYGNAEEQGPYLEGDIMLPEARNGVTSPSQLWDKGIVPYELSGSFTSAQKNTLSKAIDEIQKNTCIKFIPHGGEKDYISFQSQSTGCWSLVGKVGGRQEVNLQSECFNQIGTVIHECLHALGFTHEQNRSDRDGFVTIMTNNIPADKMINFEKNSKDETFKISYDYGSVLHYSPTAFSKNGQPTIVTKGSPATKNMMGQRKKLSDSDIKKLNKMYCEK